MEQSNTTINQVQFEENAIQAWFSYKNMYLSSFYNVNTITLSCNMSQYNQSTYNTKKSHKTCPLCTGATCQSKQSTCHKLENF